MRDLRLITGLAVALASMGLAGQEAKSAEDELLELLNTPITVASGKAMTTRESPGIITLVTREDILSSGARDLLDVLRLVPGFDFASDIQGTVGPAVRGLWGFEGKVLLLVDGQELNETRYGTVQFGNHVPVDQIRQVEVIRGPGSAIYGGFAELAVINVVTRTGADLKGVSGGLALGTSATGTNLRNYHAAYGKSRGDLVYSLAVSAGEAQRGQERWNSFGTVVDTAGNSALTQGFYNFGLTYRGFSLRAIHDSYSVEDFTPYRDFAPTPMRFSGDYLDLRYAWSLSPTLKLLPRLTYKVQQPWYYPEDPSGRKREASRLTTGIQAQWQPSPSLDILVGLDTWTDEGRISGGDPATRFWSNGKDKIRYENRALYGQALWNTPFGNFTAGARYDHNSQFGSSFVPRFAYTKTWTIFHLKALASQAFRAPAIENFELNPTVRPEKTTALELEVGARFGQHFLAVNVFDLSVKDPMVYYYDPVTDFENYTNYEKVGSRGFEADYQVRGDWGHFRTTLTVFQAKDNQVPDFTVSGEKNALVGLPNVKVTFQGNFKLGGGWSFAPAMIALGPRFTHESETGPVRRDSATLVNLMCHHRPRGSQLFFTGGVHNLADARIGFPKAYRGTDGDTYPSPARTFFLRATYNF